MVDRLERNKQAISTETLKSGGGGGNDGGMEKRIEKLETTTSQMAVTLARIEAKMATSAEVAEIKHAISKIQDTVFNLPTKGFVWSRYWLTVSAMVAGFTFIVANKDYIIKLLGFL